MQLLPRAGGCRQGDKAQGTDTQNSSLGEMSEESPSVHLGMLFFLLTMDYFCPVLVQLNSRCQATFRRCAQELMQRMLLTLPLHPVAMFFLPTHSKQFRMLLSASTTYGRECHTKHFVNHTIHGYQETLSHHWCRPCRTYGSQGAAQTGLHQCHHCRTGSPGWWHLQNRTLQGKLH